MKPSGCVGKVVVVAEVGCQGGVNVDGDQGKGWDEEYIFLIK